MADKAVLLHFLQPGGIAAKLGHGKTAAGESSGGSELQGPAVHRRGDPWAVRWYLMFPISYRDLGLMLADRGVTIAHTTIFRWIQAYAAELEKRIRPHLRPAMARGGSTRRM